MATATANCFEGKRQENELRNQGPVWDAETASLRQDRHLWVTTRAEPAAYAIASKKYFDPAEA